MLGIAKKIYNGVTDQRVFRLLILVSMFFVYMQVMNSFERGILGLGQMKQDVFWIKMDSAAMRKTLSEIESEIESIESYTRQISDNTRY
jgi:hypothetical protein